MESRRKGFAGAGVFFRSFFPDVITMALAKEISKQKELLGIVGGCELTGLGLDPPRH